MINLTKLAIIPVLVGTLTASINTINYFEKEHYLKESWSNFKSKEHYANYSIKEMDKGDFLEVAKMFMHGQYGEYIASKKYLDSEQHLKDKKAYLKKEKKETEFLNSRYDVGAFGKEINNALFNYKLK